MATAAGTHASPEAYLEHERKAETRSEYFRGEVFAMAGGTPEHSLICTNTTRELSDRLRKSPCRVYSSDLRLAIPSAGVYTYPDVMVVCSEPLFLDDRRDTISNPDVVIEVLSESTKNYDRRLKFQGYRTIPSLSEYLMIAQDKVHVEHWTRQPDGHWLLTQYADPISRISLASVGVSLQLSDVYEKVDFATVQAP